MFPKRMRTYLQLNVVLAVLMAIVLAVRTELRTGHHLLIDIGFILFFSAVLATLSLGPFALIEIYLYRRKKGVWYDWQNGTRRAPRDLYLSQQELGRRRSEAYVARLSREEPAPDDHHDRTRLFQANPDPDRVSRAALLMTVADNLAQSGKREAAQRCYRQIIQRFADSHQAKEAAGRLESSAKI